MNRDIAQGEWKQLSGKIKQKWGKLTDDDLTRAQGDRDYLVGRLHEQYGIARDKVEGDLDTLGYANAGSSNDLQDEDRTEQGGNLDREDPSGRSSSNFGTGSTSNRGNPGQKAGSSRLGDPQGDAGGDLDEYGNANMSLQSPQQDDDGAGYTLEAGSAQDKSTQQRSQGSGASKPGQGSSPSGDKGADKSGQKRGPQGRGNSSSGR